MEANDTVLSFYFKSTNPVYTYSLDSQDSRLTQVLEDVRMVRHGNHIFVHLRSEFELERALCFLGHNQKQTKLSASSAA
ncbi:hypothetical protein [Rufibacter tibetensis]|uniref:Uncharacterized protein n=1 Tax=Rufibacter tibetensis TaxID=512763 RepID=A0A0P0C564_9BACT|nr:hypothetical protein [Rufibacter tibetensis]ALI98371.1 hypothetical protein DC20_04490 [Rufibacter tibetensis]